MQRSAHRYIHVRGQLRLQLHTQFGMQLELVVHHHLLAADAQIIINEMTRCEEKRKSQYDNQSFQVMLY
jgi:hypothetical protein